MKKSSLFLVGAIVLAMAVSSCKDNFQEGPDPTPVPIEHKTVLNFNIDWPANEIENFALSTVVYRNGANYETSHSSIITIYDNFSQNISVTIPDSLRGRNCEMSFFVGYFHNGLGSAAELIRNVNFSSEDTTYLGNIGFSDYYWYTHPTLFVVIVPDNIKLYASNK